MWNRLKYTPFILLIILVANSCREFEEKEIYQRPEWLKGKLYSQMKTIPEIAIFTECLERTGIAERIDETGYYTVFAPTNEAFEEFFNTHPQYGGDISGIPLSDLDRIVRLHILQNGWTLTQLRTLDFQGWIDEENEFYNEPRGYKRETIMLDSLKKRWVINEEGESRIVLDETVANGYKKTIPDSRKYMPLYYEELFDAAGYTASDYEYFFERPYEGGLYYAHGKLITPSIAQVEQIPAENGFIHIIDRVVSELPNMEQVLLESVEKPDDQSYSDFLSMLYSHSSFSYDEYATEIQEGASEGLEVDSIFNLSFPELAIDINREETGSVSSNRNYTIRENNTIIAPTNTALDLFFDGITQASGKPYWKNRSAIPEEIIMSIINSLLSEESAYRSELTSGILNGTGDLITVPDGNIIYKAYGSNGMFYGINEMITPRIFISVTAPVYLRPKYNSMFYAIEYAGILQALKRADTEYTFFLTSDDVVKTDSSMLFYWQDINLNKYYFEEWILSAGSRKRIDRVEMKKLLMHQVAIGVPEYTANKEFFRTLAGSHLYMDHTNNIVSGSAQSTYGYMGSIPIDIVYSDVEDDIDNGITYEVNGLLSMTSLKAFSVLSSYPKFFNLLDRVGLVDKASFTASVIDNAQQYTIFAPSDAAWDSVNTDDMTDEELRQLLLSHFITGTMIFTDDKIPDGYYPTLSYGTVSGESGNSQYRKVYVETQPDRIVVRYEENVIVDFVEDETKNILVAYDRYTDNSEFDYVSNCVLHQIENVIRIE